MCIRDRYLPNYDSIKTYDEFLEMINNVSVVATTCLGIQDVLFTLRKKDFDYVILDEASQISIPVALGPLRSVSYTHLDVYKRQVFIES